jgi:hypothetical protein
VIVNDGSVEDLRAQVDEIWAQLAAVRRPS